MMETVPPEHGPLCVVRDGHITHYLITMNQTKNQTSVILTVLHFLTVIVVLLGRLDESRS